MIVRVVFLNNASLSQKLRRVNKASTKQDKKRQNTFETNLNLKSAQCHLAKKQLRGMIRPQSLSKVQ
jgi:hypothetical protein